MQTSAASAVPIPNANPAAIVKRKILRADCMSTNRAYYNNLWLDMLRMGPAVNLPKVTHSDFGVSLHFCNVIFLLAMLSFCNAR